MLRTLRGCGAAAALLLGCTAALAQIVPPVQLPNVPGLPTEDLTRTVDGVLRTAEPEQRLREVRRLRIRELLRANRTALEADPRGALAIRNEVVALSPSEEVLSRARAEGFNVGRTRTLEGLDTTIVVLQAPPGMSTRRALQWLRRADPAGVYDYNHVLMGSGEAPATTLPPSAELTPGDAVAATDVRVGLIDAGVQRTHAVFDGVTIHQHGCAGNI
ncbi:MAG: S8 family serine peptidase, partial [Steroidobacteraceae bacterium]